MTRDRMNDMTNKANMRAAIEWLRSAPEVDDLFGALTLLHIAQAEKNDGFVGVPEKHLENLFCHVEEFLVGVRVLKLVADGKVAIDCRRRTLNFGLVAAASNAGGAA